MIRIGDKSAMAILLAAGLSIAGAARAADDVVTAKRQGGLNAILHTISAEAVAAERMTCMFGEEPGKVAQGRSAGKDFLPDAADTCVAALTRTAREGHLPDLYRTLLSQLGGNSGDYAKLPDAIGNAVMNGNGKMPIGDPATDVPPSLAFDAGFTVAYQQGSAAKAPAANAADLKPIAEACLAVKQEAGACFSAGYVYGAKAFAAR